MAESSFDVSFPSWKMVIFHSKQLVYQRVHPIHISLNHCKSHETTIKSHGATIVPILCARVLKTDVQVGTLKGANDVNAAPCPGTK